MEKPERPLASVVIFCGRLLLEAQKLVLGEKGDWVRSKSDFHISGSFAGRISILCEGDQRECFYQLGCSDQRLFKAVSLVSGAEFYSCCVFSFRFLIRPLHEDIRTVRATNVRQSQSLEGSHVGVLSETEADLVPLLLYFALRHDVMGRSFPLSFKN